MQSAEKIDRARSVFSACSMRFTRVRIPMSYSPNNCVLDTLSAIAFMSICRQGGLDLCQSLLNRALFQRAQQNARQVTHSIGNTRVQLPSTKPVNGVG
jgi:hypothetical protein